MNDNQNVERDEYNREAAMLNEEELKEWIGEERPLRRAADKEDADEPKEAGKEGTNDKEEKKASVALNTFKEVLSWCLTLVLAIVVALLLKRFVIINATVPTGSMEHTIEPGDDLLGLRFVYQFSNPRRGDIIIFDFPDNKSEKYVKRVIGLPGEKIEIKDGQIYINDSKNPLTETYLKEEWVRATGPYEFEVPEDCYLVLGDNRNDSYDARYWTNTYVTKDDIVGKAYIIYYPFSRMGSLYK